MKRPQSAAAIRVPRACCKHVRVWVTQSSEQCVYLTFVLASCAVLYESRTRNDQTSCDSHGSSLSILKHPPVLCYLTSRQHLHATSRPHTQQRVQANNHESNLSHHHLQSIKMFLIKCPFNQKLKTNDETHPVESVYKVTDHQKLNVVPLGMSAPVSGSNVQIFDDFNIYHTFNQAKPQDKTRTKCFSWNTPRRLVRP